MWAHLRQTGAWEAREKSVNEFNASHKWRKRGVAMTPVRYRVGWRGTQMHMVVYDDGTVLLSTEALEIGQGLYTKVIQYASYYLSQIVPGSEVPMGDIKVGQHGNDKIAWGMSTGGSTTSECACEAVRDCIEKLAVLLAPVKETMEKAGETLSFKSLIVKTLATTSPPLQFTGISKHAGEDQAPMGKYGYCIFGCALSEVEVDVLTGETTILYTKLLCDHGQSLNPTIDCGQAEGGFMQGVGFFLREKEIHNEETGELLTDGTWEYKIPCSQDVPLKLDVEFFPRAFPQGIQGSKASGEPPLVLATSVFCAVRHAISAARKHFGKEPFFRLDTPATGRDIALACGANLVA